MTTETATTRLATGIKLDHEEYMPESWNRSFSLQFEPVDKRDRMVDYDEMIPEGNGSDSGW